MARHRSPTPSLFLLPLLLLLAPLSNATPPPLHRAKKLAASDETPEIHLLAAPAPPSTPPPPPPPPPTTFFEVTRPISVPPKAKRCSTLVLQHDFGYTYGQPPTTAPYRPPTGCHHPHKRPSRIVLEWKATCEGRQFDRIFGVWVGGVELLRSCTAEPRPNGIVWTVEKDVTRYASLLAKPQTMAVFLGNIVDSTYTGVYHVDVSIHFYYGGSGEGDRRLETSRPGFASPADLVIPVSRDLPLNDGLWFLVENSTDVQSKEVEIPTNAYRAVLEVYVSFHSSDEFWYSNPPNEYIFKNNLIDVAGNGPFREVTVSVDDSVVGAVWPFTVIYTGGINPLLWRPITGIGSFNLPSYDIEITPFLGNLVDGKPHKFGFGVTDALSVWFIDANLHLWLDSKSTHTSGSLLKHNAPDAVSSLDSKFKGLDGTFLTTASRRVSATGWVKSSHGKITTHFYQGFNFKNWMEYRGNGSTQVINQTIEVNSGVYAKNPSSVLYSEEVFQDFPLYLYTGTEDQTNDSYSLVANISFAFNEKRFAGERFGFFFSSLKNIQNGQGDMIVKGNLVTSGLGSTQQAYKYESTDGCYFRNVSARNYTILHDDSGDTCSKNSQLGSWYMFKKWTPFL